MELSVIVTSTSPRTASHTIILTFFISLFGFLTTSLAFLWYGLKRLVLARSKRIPLLATLRQAALFSLVITLTFFFSSLSVLTVWDIVPLFLATVLIEFFFQADKVAPMHESS